jgi:hypothetical protein
MPGIKSMSAIFEPKILPSVIPISPEVIAENATAISGALDANDKTINPIVSSPNLVILAIFTELSETICDDFDNITSEINNISD